MEARAAIPVALPHHTPTTSYWQDPPDAEIADYMSASTLPEELVDTVIVGSGITGAGIAWGLLHGDSPEKRFQGRLVMLEARQACSGATGRNGKIPSSPTPRGRTTQQARNTQLTLR